MSLYSGNIPAWVWICLLIVLGVYTYSILRKFFKENKQINGKYVNTGYNSGHIGDSYLTTTKYSEYDRKIAKFCLKVLNYMQSNGNAITPDKIDEICGEYADEVRSSLSEHLAFHATKGYNGIPKTNSKEIKKAIHYYKMVINSIKYRSTINV